MITKEGSRMADEDDSSIVEALATQYEVWLDGTTEEIDAADWSAAEEQAIAWVRDGSWGEGKARVSFKVTHTATDECRNFSVEVGEDPEPPACAEDKSHDWKSPEFLGGCTENPGVWSTGGTTIVTKTVCTNCGIYRVETSLGSQRNPDECDTVEYEDADDI